MRADQPPKLVIFDCDGVLVNSEPIFNRVLHEFLLICGAPLTYQECCDAFTGKNKFAVETYLTDAGLNVPDNWAKGFYERALDALGKEVEAIDGVHALLEALLKANIPFCVASNGLMAKMQVTLRRTQMLSYFEGQMFSAYDIGNRKPAPDVFLHAAKVNNVLPDDCVVIEDSASGFEAAQNAQMPCFAYSPENPNTKIKLFGATAFESMSKLPDLLNLT